MSLDLFYLLTIAIFMAFPAKIDSQTNSNGLSTPIPCGQYGFRCVDNKSYQVCLTSTENDDPPEEIHECREGMVCDEDNPAFCTPVDPLFTTQKPPRVARDSEYFMYDEFFDRNNANTRKPSEAICTEDTIHTTISTTEESFLTTTELMIAPEFDCEGYGFYPDLSNQTLFWFCDVPENGQGYNIRHMICGQDRVFDPIHRACVIIGTTRTRLQDEKKWKKQADSSEYQRDRRFSCCGKHPGRYADDINCRLYHYCLTKEFAPVEELSLTCPRGTAYDPSTNKCSCYATYRCVGRRESQSNTNVLDDYALRDYPEDLAEFEASLRRERSGRNVNCQSPMRFRDVNYCDGYFLCFGDQVIGMDCPEYYKFDDNLLECLPERIARCQ